MISSSRSIASMLTDFTPKLVPADRMTVFTASKERVAAASEADEPSEDVVELIDYELKVKEAFSAGRQSGQAEASVLFDAEKIRLERDFQEQLAAAEALFLEQAGARIAMQVSEGLARIAAHLSGSLATVLTPLIEENMRSRAIGAFAGEVARLTKGLEAVVIDITGPAHLLNALRQSPEFDAIRFTLIEADQAELSLKLDDTVIETRLGHLIDSLRDHIR